MRKVAAQLGVHRTTALRWRHRFLRCPARIQDLAMRGVVEADETCVLELFKGQRKALVLALALAQRPSRRRGGKARKARPLERADTDPGAARANYADGGLRVADGAGQGSGQGSGRGGGQGGQSKR